MAVSIKKVTLWRTHVENKPGTLRGILAPLAEAGADLQVVMGYHYHGVRDTAVIEVCPVSGKKSTAAVGKVGLKAAAIPTLLVQGDNKPGLGHAVTQAIAEAGINITFLVAQVIGEQFSAVMGFEGEADSKQAAALVKKTAKKFEK
jgi:predicted amino acid-binding ACT domain protein